MKSTYQTVAQKQTNLNKQNNTLLKTYTPGTHPLVGYGAGCRSTLQPKINVVFEGRTYTNMHNLTISSDIKERPQDVFVSVQCDTD